MLYVTGCLGEAGIILVHTAFDEDVTETFIIFIEVAQGSRDVASASSELQKTWNVALQSFNPTTGLGVE